METKNTVLLYTDCLEQLDYLSLEERGLLFTAILNYQAGKDLPEMDRTMMMIFIPIRQQIDRSNEAYARKCEKNRENALKRRQANASERKQSQVLDSDNDNEPEPVPVPDNEPEPVPENTNVLVVGGVNRQHLHKSEDEPDDVEKVIRMWNAIPHTRDIKSILPCTKRWNELIMSLDMFGLESVLEAIEKVASSKYLQKRGKVNFDNFMNPNVVQKLIEGTYDEDYKEAKASDGLEFCM